MCVITRREECKADKARLFSVVTSDMTRGHKLKYKWSCQGTLFHCESDWSLTEVGQRDYRVSIVGNTWTPTRHGTGQSALGGPAWTGRLNQMISSGQFKPQCQCVIIHYQTAWPGSGSTPQSKKGRVCEVAPDLLFDQCLNLGTTFHLIYHKFMQELIIFFNQHFAV